MANPKRKVSKSKRDMRRHHWVNAVKPALVTTCENCGAKKEAHRVCPECGFYRGHQYTEGQD
jgi:large subunit ribosomal protein L32